MKYIQYFNIAAMQKKWLMLAGLLFPVFCSAQYTQTIKGTVTDKESKIPLAGVTVAVTTVNPPAGTATDGNGNFLIENIPVGKHTIQVSY
ncbi:MAG: carboxypeptidase-like regulatory domain-containing protein, partial [Taibaiella sp.]|nr:carboxypeptidase-like regulatory domain-containing protein [Taibaiella sp.]